MKDLVGQKSGAGNIAAQPIHDTSRPSVKFEDLPLDVLYTIVSKLPPKEFARTSVLSGKWRCVSSVCPRLTFDDVEECKCSRGGLHQHTMAFIHETNAILQKHRGKVVETLEVRVYFADSLVRHLNNWVDFAVASQTKNLNLNLKPEWLWRNINNDRYVLPLEQFDNGSISRLQHMQLCFVSLKPPSQFKGFPNLRKLHISLLHVSRKDLEHMLSHCRSLVWLHIERCHLYDYLILDSPLSNLLYLRIEYCILTRLKFHAMNLATFQYEGDFIPIDLSHSLKLHSANIQFTKVDFQHVVLSLLSGLPNVQNLTFHIWWPHLEKQWLWETSLKLSCLRNLQLLLILPAHVENVLYLVSFLRATPFIENLEFHFSSYTLWLADGGPRRQDIGQCNKYNYLKNICVTGFKGARGQVELILHVVENAPALEAISVNTKQLASKEFWPYGKNGPPFEQAKRIATTALGVALPKGVKLCVI
ncbi:unnamed protein product [Urochloa decumbens]|uniref:F-box domain-containing protein n=1 Tax=Urochloa decumbens TaxID=240449 RepID=A0ABC9BBG0_9POAL